MFFGREPLVLKIYQCICFSVRFRLTYQDVFQIYDDLQRCIDDLITGKNKTVFDTMKRRSLPDVMIT